nr:hypothetical protein BaRGS_019002 [Batillaria attramentaria]
MPQNELQDEQPVYRVIHEFPTQQETQLPLTPGDLVHVEETADNGWWRGRVKGKERSGWFPSSFLEEVGDQAPDKDTEASTEVDGEAVSSDQQNPKPRISSFLIRKKQGNRSLKENSFSLKNLNPQLSGDVAAEEKKDQHHAGPQLDQEVYGLLAVNRNKSPDQAWLLEEKSDGNKDLLDSLHLLPLRKDPSKQAWEERVPASQRSSVASFNSDTKDLAGISDPPAQHRRHYQQIQIQQRRDTPKEDDVSNPDWDEPTSSHASEAAEKVELSDHDTEDDFASSILSDPLFGSGSIKLDIPGLTEDLNSNPDLKDKDKEQVHAPPQHILMREVKRQRMTPKVEKMIECLQH